MLAEVVPIKPFMHTLMERSVFTMTQEAKWAFLSKFNRHPKYVMVGGNFLVKLHQEFSESPIMRGKENSIDIVNGMVLVRVPGKDMIECGE